MKYKKIIKIPPSELKTIDAAINWQDGDDEQARLDEDDAIIYGAIFSNNFEADIKVCGVHYEKDCDNGAWTEMVLFDENDDEVCCSDVRKDFLGEWTLTYGGDSYTVIVEKVTPVNCDNNCESCGKYTSVHYNGGKYTEYNCLVANKDVIVIHDEKREIW